MHVSRLLLLALSFTMAGTSLAQAQANARVCAQLEGQLAQLSRPQGNAREARRLEDAFNRQRYELDRAVAYSRQLGCGRFFLFGGQPAPQCGEVQARIGQMERNLQQLGGQLEQAQGGRSGQNEARQRQVLAALQQNGCRGGAVAQPQQQEQRRGLFGLLFGGGAQEAAPPQEQLQQPEAPRQQSATFRTVCVRMCDGYFYPISNAVSSSRLTTDAQICQRTCPGTQAQLFSHPTSAEIEDAISVDGRAYRDTPNAFRYQREFVENCSCKPAQGGWTEVVATTPDEDTSLREGDIIVDEERARAMSQPGAAPPIEAVPQYPDDEDLGAAPEEDVPVTEEVIEESPPEEAPRPAIRQVGPLFAPGQ